MNDSKVRATDLNLLVTLAAILETQNVSRAAEDLGLSQPAVSHALNRLRETFDDALLVRSGRAMVPTPRAEELRPQVREVLATIEKLLVADEDFVPEETRRTFVIATNGFSAQLLIPSLVRELHARAPMANLRIVPTGHRDLRELLIDGQVDVCLISGRMDHLPESLMMRAIFDDPFVSTVGETHAFGEKVSLDDFANAPHILVSPRGDHLGVLDSMLAQRGLRRRVALVLPDFMTVPAVLRETDYVITTPVSIARLFGEQQGLKQFTPPDGLGMDAGALIALWHERVQNDPINRWFRRLVFEVGEQMSLG